MICLLKVENLLHTEFVTVAHVAEGEFLKNELTWRKGYNNNNNNNNNNRFILVFTALYYLPIKTGLSWW